jgi:hypothetical protein
MTRLAALVANPMKRRCASFDTFAAIQLQRTAGELISIKNAGVGASLWAYCALDAMARTFRRRQP